MTNNWFPELTVMGSKYITGHKKAVRKIYGCICGLLWK